MTHMETEETARLMEAALAEAGHPTKLTVTNEGRYLSPLEGGPPPRAVWKAFTVVFPEGTSCWTCWQRGDDEYGAACEALGLGFEDCGRTS